LRQFLFEAGSLTLLGGIVGIILGFLLTIAFSLLFSALGFALSLSLSPTSILVAVGFSMTTGIIFGFYPAWQASRLNPIEALRHD